MRDGYRREELVGASSRKIIEGVGTGAAEEDVENKGHSRGLGEWTREQLQRGVFNLDTLICRDF